MPPIVPQIIIAIAFASATVVAIVSGFKYKDKTSGSLIPGLIYMTLHFSIVSYVPEPVAELWRTWGFLALALNILFTLVWRYSSLQRGGSWKT